MCQKSTTHTHICILFAIVKYVFTDTIKSCKYIKLSAFLCNITYVVRNPFARTLNPFQMGFRIYKNNFQNFSYPVYINYITFYTLFLRAISRSYTTSAPLSSMLLDIGIMWAVLCLCLGILIANVTQRQKLFVHQSSPSAFSSFSLTPPRGVRARVTFQVDLLALSLYQFPIMMCISGIFHQLTKTAFNAIYHFAYR